MLLHIPSLFAADELLRIREALAQADWADGKVTAGHQSAKAKHNLQLPEAHPLAKEIGSAIIERLWQTPQFMSAALPHKVFPPLINCYREGGNFGNNSGGGKSGGGNSGGRESSNEPAPAYDGFGDEEPF